MKRRIIVAVVVGILGAFGIASGLAAPFIDAAYCLVQPDECK